MHSKVGISGIRGSYSDEAASVLLGEAAEICFFEGFPAVFDAVATGTVGFAVVPVSNKIIGPITEVAGLLAADGFRSLEKYRLKVRHLLLGTKDTKLGDIVAVRSHPAALAQCSKFLSTFAELKVIEAVDTASSVKQIAETGDRGQAAICSKPAADIYGAKILASDIMDDPDNWTEFHLIAKSEGS